MTKLQHTTTDNNRPIRYEDYRDDTTLSGSERLMLEIYKDQPTHTLVGKLPPRLFVRLSLEQWFDGIVPAHTKLVWKMVHAQRSWIKKLNLDEDDVFSVGVKGLVRAAHLYDHTSEVAFGVYAKTRIAGEIRNYLKDAQAKYEGTRYGEKNPYNMNEAFVEMLEDKTVSPALADLRQGLKDVRLELTNLQADTLEKYLAGSSTNAIGERQGRSGQAVRKTMRIIVEKLRPHVY